MEASKVIVAARQYIGTPFHHQGRVKGVGIDCVGLIECVARDIGYDVPVHDGYGREPFKGMLEAKLDQYLERCQPVVGCVLLMRYGKSYPYHVAIHAGDTIIHAWAGAGECVEHTYDDKWHRRTVRGYQWPLNFL